MYPRYHDDEVKILLQIDQNKNIPHLLQNGYQDVKAMPITLEPGNEYIIEVSANGQKSTKGFRDLSVEKRQCKLSNEVLQQSKFNTYTKSNCRYECHINIAYKYCGCVPWDYIHFQKNATECDVFGRTCFLNSMEHSQRVQKVYCPHCIEDCDKMNFLKSIESQTSLEFKESIIFYQNEYISTTRSRYV